MKIQAEKSSRDELEKRITSGAYRDMYLVYCRKSTDDADLQKNSIDYQRKENTRFAKRLGLPIATVTIPNFCTDGYITERHSGFKEDNDVHISEDGTVQFVIDRPKFKQLLRLLHQGYFRGVICLCWDRISRNSSDNALVRKLMRGTVDFRFATTQYERSSSGELHMDIDSMFAQHHSRVTSEKVTLATRVTRDKGICTYKAPIGYLNTGSMETKPLDPVRAPIIKRMFDLYATGDYSLNDLVRYATEQGLTTVPKRTPRTREEMLDETIEVKDIPKKATPISLSSISRMLSCRFYTGRVLNSDGVYIPSKSHVALVNDELFEKVQAQLKRKHVSIYNTIKTDLPLRGFMRCGECDRVYTPYTKKGHQYYYSRCVAGCTNSMKSIGFATISDRLKEVMRGLVFTKDELAYLDAQTNTRVHLLEERRAQELAEIERAKKAVREKQQYLRTNKLTLLASGAYTPEALMEEDAKLHSELLALQEREQISDYAVRETLREIVKLSELINTLIPRYEFAEPHEKEQIIRVLFSELRLSDKTFEYKCRKGVEFLQNRSFPFCDPTGIRTRITAVRG